MSGLARSLARAFVLAFFFGVMALVVSQTSASLARAQGELRASQLAAEIERVRQDNLALAESLEYRRSASFVYAAAKRELSLIEPGEIRLDLDGPLPPDSPSATPSPAPPAVRPPVPEMLDFGYIRAWRSALFGGS